MQSIKALIFDVFGTVVDWRSSIIAELQELGEKHGIKGNGASLLYRGAGTFTYAHTHCSRY
jgi:FMN phosphatase YigB (HAD superfamily)